MSIVHNKQQIATVKQHTETTGKQQTTYSKNGIAVNSRQQAANTKGASMANDNKQQIANSKHQQTVNIHK